MAARVARDGHDARIARALAGRDAGLARRGRPQRGRDPAAGHHTSAASAIHHRERCRRPSQTDPSRSCTEPVGAGGAVLIAGGPAGAPDDGRPGLLDRAAERVADLGRAHRERLHPQRPDGLRQRRLIQRAAEVVGDLAQIARERADRRVAPVPIALERAPDHRVDPGWQAAPDRGDRRNVLLGDRAPDLVIAVAPEQPIAGQRLPQHDPHREHVGARIDGLAADLIRHTPVRMTRPA
jgi:hypothetical protein